MPDEVVERLERLATRDRMSLSAVAVGDLEQASRRADNCELTQNCEVDVPGPRPNEVVELRPAPFAKDYLRDDVGVGEEWANRYVSRLHR